MMPGFFFIFILIFNYKCFAGQNCVGCLGKENGKENTKKTEVSQVVDAHCPLGNSPKTMRSSPSLRSNSNSNGISLDLATRLPKRQDVTVRNVSGELIVNPLVQPIALTFDTSTAATQIVNPFAQPVHDAFDSHTATSQPVDHSVQEAVVQESRADSMPKSLIQSRQSIGDLLVHIAPIQEASQVVQAAQVAAQTASVAEAQMVQETVQIAQVVQAAQTALVTEVAQIQETALVTEAVPIQVAAQVAEAQMVQETVQTALVTQVNGHVPLEDNSKISDLNCLIISDFVFFCGQKFLANYKKNQKVSRKKVLEFAEKVRNFSDILEGVLLDILRTKVYIDLLSGEIVTLPSSLSADKICRICSDIIEDAKARNERIDRSFFYPMEEIFFRYDRNDGLDQDSIFNFLKERLSRYFLALDLNSFYKIM